MIVTSMEGIIEDWGQTGDGAGVKKAIKLFPYFNCKAYVTSLKTSLPSAPSFPAGWRSGCSDSLCVTFMTRSLCSFICLFLSARFSPSTTLAGKGASAFRLWVARSSHSPLPRPSMPWHCLQRETHVCECACKKYTHTHTHTCYNGGSFFTSFPTLTVLQWE